MSDTAVPDKKKELLQNFLFCNVGKGFVQCFHNLRKFPLYIIVDAVFKEYPGAFFGNTDQSDLAYIKGYNLSVQERKGYKAH